MAKTIFAALGDYYHDKDLAIKSLEKAIGQLKEELNFEVELTCLSVNDVVASLDEQPDLVILFAENRLNPEDPVVNAWMGANEAAKLEKYVANGGSWLAWHSGLASYENIKPYIKMLRGYFLSHPDEHQMVTYKLEQDALFVEKQFEFLDEHYFVKVEEVRTNIFLRSDSVDGSSIAGWYHEHVEGKVLCLTPAHLEAGLMHEQFLQVLAASIKWCL